MHRERAPISHWFVADEMLIYITKLGRLAEPSMLLSYTDFKTRVASPFSFPRKQLKRLGKALALSFLAKLC